MEDGTNTQKNDEVNALIDEILGHPPQKKETGEAAEASSAPSPLSALAANPELLTKLPELISVMKPLLGGSTPTSGGTDKKLALLCALKPYLSPKRCETIDYITKMSKLGDTLKHIKL